MVSLDGVTYLAGVHRRWNIKGKCEQCFEPWPCAPMRSLDVDRHIDEQVAKAVEEGWTSVKLAEAIRFILAAAIEQGGSTLREGDAVVLTHMEHHANIVPWQVAAGRSGAKVVVVLRCRIWSRGSSSAFCYC